MEKYYSVKKDGLPKKDGYYMVKVFVSGMPEYDCIEICFRNFTDGKWDKPYYTDPDTDKIIGWWENDSYL